MISQAPPGIVEMAINNVEDFARDKGIDEIVEEVVVDQMKSVGMDPNMLSQNFQRLFKIVQKSSLNSETEVAGLIVAKREPS